MIRHRGSGLLFPLIALVSVAVATCRLAAAGDAAPAPGVDPLVALFRILTDFGALGAFIIYLIWQKQKDQEQRREADKRLHELDRELVILVKENTKVNYETVAALHLINAEMKRLTTASSPTRVYRKE